MRTLLALLLALSLSLPTLAQPAPVNQALASRAVRSVALLYSQDSSGTMRMHCTVTAYDKSDGGYKFATAAHCMGDDDKAHQKVVDTDDIPFYVTFDERGDKTFYPATVKAVGYQSRGDDLAVVHVQTKADWPTIPLGDEGKVDVEKPETTAIINVASPLGLGKQMFRGHISSVYLDRPIIQGDINWKGTMLLSIQVGPGSSGSAVISEDQEAIVGILVGTIGGSNVIGIPVSRFKKFEKEVKDGDYKWSHDYKSKPDSK
jgi:hypothetical protein